MAKAEKRILEGWATEAELAAECQTTLQTLRRWRRRGIGPPWAKAPGIGVIYPIEGSRDWLRRNLVQPRTKTA